MILSKADREKLIEVVRAAVANVDTPVLGQALSGILESYEDTFAALEADAKQARESILKAGRDPKWGAFYTWLDDNKDATVKRLADLTGEQERANTVLHDRVAVLHERIADLETRATRAEANEAHWKSKADEHYRSAVDATNGKDSAWRAVWERLASHGMLSFIGGNGTGMGRALAFIDDLATRAKAART